MPPMPELERTPLASKKFIAYLLAEITWKIVLLVTLWNGRDILLARTDIDGGGVGMWWFMFTVVIVAGFVEVGFIGGQSWLDKYVRVAQITAGAGGAKGGPNASSNDAPDPPSGA